MLEINRCVAQEDEFGCQVACIATILDWTYDETQKMFSLDFSKEGISQQNSADFLSGFGFTSIYKALNSYIGYESTCKKMLQPFADIHTVSIQRFSDKNDIGHAIIMTGDGILLDPKDGNIFDDRILLVNSVYGYWYPENWDFRTLKEKQNVVDSSSSGGNSSNS